MSTGMEKMSAMWEKFSLLEYEGNKFVVQNETMLEEYLIAAKFFTKRALNMEAIAKTFKLIWRSRKGFEVRDMGNHLVLFAFKDETDVAKVLMGEPWSFDKHLVALQETKRGEAIQSLEFDSTCFWVQIHDFPVGCMLVSTAKGIGSVIGTVVESDEDEVNMGGFNYILLRIKVDILKPLCRGRKLSLSGGKEGWVRFKYKQLPIICY